MSQYSCKTEVYQCEVSVDEYLETCVDVPQFLQYCKQCTNYDKVWSCPSFSFDPVSYFKEYETLLVVGHKIILPDKLTGQIFTKEEQTRLLEELLMEPKKSLDAKMLALENQHPKSKALSGGSCLYCSPGTCARRSGMPCRFPEKMRYSIEALGGNVGLTVTKYLNQELEWIEENHLPHHFILVAGLLLKE